MLSVTEQDRYAEVLTRLQAELVKLSPNSRHITVTGATHYTLVSEQVYADIVSDAIRALVTAARTGPTARGHRDRRTAVQRVMSRLRDGHVGGAGIRSRPR